MRSVTIAVLAGVLIGCCRGQQPITSVKANAQATPAHSGTVHRFSYRESELVRVPDQLHVYRLGRLPDGDSMRDAGNYYHVEQSAYWNRFNPARRQVVTSGASVTSGPSSSIVAKAYRPVPHDQELTELRNEARDEKDKVVHELEKAKLAREKLEGLTQGLAQTDRVIKEAQTEISELKAQNDDLRRKAAMKESERSDRDFGKIEAMSKGSKTDGLQPGPVSDD
jgi:hypothetical protein